MPHPADLRVSTRTKLRFARLFYHLLHAGRRLIGRRDDVEVERRGIRWRIDLREGIDLAIYLFGRFEPDTVQAYTRILKPGDTVIDIGANVGAHTLPLAACVAPHGRVVALEPTAFAFAKLQANIALNPALGAIIQPERAMLVAPGSATLPTEIYSSWPLVRSGAYQHPKHQGVKMDTRGARALSLDAYLAEAGIPRLKLIKLDVDGYEYDVLRGAAETLRRHRPVVLMELMPYGLEEHGATLGQLLALLQPLGYRLFDLAGKPLAYGADLVRRIPPGGGINVLCRCP